MAVVAHDDHGDAETAGGQAGTSSRIENYLGFPVGLSGADLALRAREQAVRFGAEILVPAEVVGLHRADPYAVVRFADGSEVSASTMIVATGVDYRTLDVPGAAALTGDHAWLRVRAPLLALDAERYDALIARFDEPASLCAVKAAPAGCGASPSRRCAWAPLGPWRGRACDAAHGKGRPKTFPEQPHGAERAEDQNIGSHAGLAQDLGRHAELADVVQRRGLLHHLGDLGPRAGGLRDQLGVVPQAHDAVADRLAKLPPALCVSALKRVSR